MIRLLTVAEMKAVEKEADSTGITYDEMMERAGAGIAEWIEKTYEKGSVLGLVGTGNNGGDTLVALGHLASRGWKCRAFLPQARHTTDTLLKRAEAAGVESAVAVPENESQPITPWVKEASIILDGVLGTGARLPLEMEVQQVLTLVNSTATDAALVAVDCPSGVNCDSGETAPQVLHMDVTLCIEAVKAGLIKSPALQYTGQLVVIPLNLPVTLTAWPQPVCFIIDDEIAHEPLPFRPCDAHKGSFGTALLAAGSITYTGAASLAAQAACRVGTGLVRLAVPGPLHLALAGHLPDVTWLILPHEMGVIAADAAEVILNNLGKTNALLLGPGWGQEDTTAEFLKRLLLSSQAPAPRRGIGFVILEDEAQAPQRKPLPPLVIDADGLKLLSRIPEWPTLLPTDTILTPHPGEMAALTGQAVEVIQAERLETAVHYAREWKAVVVLKGAFTVIAAPDGRAGVLPVATAALAHAGSGDVLAGIITGLRAQGLGAFDAAVTGAWVHGQAGLTAAGDFGSTRAVLASDLISAIPDVI